MEEIRRHHNNVKRELIRRVVGPRECVLDVGCGRGGDFKKWKHIGGIKLFACDPDEESLVEAKNRSGTIGIDVTLVKGDITSIKMPPKNFDSICYNFSLQYTFQNEKLFFKTLECIMYHLKIGGKFFGCIPDSDMILMKTPYTDDLGNFFSRKDDTGNGSFGEKVFVHLADTPYYQDGPIPEPIAYKDILITSLEANGFEKVEWKPLGVNGITKMYSQFIFVKYR
jgi:SAM-dependent methyltransferase